MSSVVRCIVGGVVVSEKVLERIVLIWLFVNWYSSRITKGISVVHIDIAGSIVCI